MIACKFCSRNIPDRSIFCPYCGKQVKIQKKAKAKPQKKAKGKPQKIGEKIGESLQKSMKGFKGQVNVFLSNLQKSVHNSESLSYVNKQKVVNVLDQLQGKKESESQPSSEEFSEWAKSVEEAISGDKCIICLQKFELKNKEKIEVSVCPNCNYAGHPKHYDTWLEKKSTCPMCRTEITKKTVVHGILSLKGDDLVFSKSAQKQ